MPGDTREAFCVSVRQAGRVSAPDATAHTPAPPPFARVRGSQSPPGLDPGDGRPQCWARSLRSAPHGPAPCGPHGPGPGGRVLAPLRHPARVLTCALPGERAHRHTPRVRKPEPHFLPCQLGAGGLVSPSPSCTSFPQSEGDRGSQAYFYRSVEVLWEAG